MKKLLYYLPRVLSVLIICFFAIFILEGQSAKFNSTDSLMHLLLTLLVVGATVVAWKWHIIGGWIFILLGIFFFFFFFTNQALLVSLLIAFVNILTGVLFLLDNKNNKSR